MALFGLAGLVLVALAGCSAPSQGTGVSSGGSSTVPGMPGAHMAGPAAQVHISQSTFDAKPAPIVQTTPESAVRSYLDWTSYAYRIGDATVAQGVTGPDEAVRVDSYIQYNLEQKKLIDQKLSSIAFGTPSVGTTNTLVPAKEQWTYRYVSIAEGNKVLGGPYTASYDSTYTVVKGKGGKWFVASVNATPHGTVK